MSLAFCATIATSRPHWTEQWRHIPQQAPGYNPIYLQFVWLHVWNKHELEQPCPRTSYEELIEVTLKKLITLRCNKCTFAATNQSTLHDHQNQAHWDSLSEDPRNPGLFRCDLCHFKAMSNINLKRHLAMTDAKLSATLHLNHSFTHFFTKQTISPPTTFPCDLCGRIFGHSDDLNSHIQRRHSHFEKGPLYRAKLQDIPANALTKLMIRWEIKLDYNNLGILF